MRALGNGTTVTGRRERNEDRFCVEAAIGLFAVADGMGGYEGGQIASRVVVDTLRDFFCRMTLETDPGFDTMPDDGRSAIECRMDVAVRRAHRQLRGKSQPGLESMGATLAAVLIRDERALIAHVGDSRVYRMRNGWIEQLTRDHSLVQDMRAAATTGAHVSEPAMGHVITRAITVQRHFDPDTRIEPLHAGDRFFICSDGVTDVLPDHILEEVLCDASLERAPDEIVDLAYDAGSTDNITAVVVDVLAD